VGLTREGGGRLTAFAEGELLVVGDEGAGDDEGKVDEAGVGWELTSVEEADGFG
jgi:hypothetical protein